MNFLRKQKKSVAAVFFFIFSVQLLFPTASYALTAGPTAPEATSFEPIDTTDMVDLKTGDFTYNIPLLEVPGPAGGIHYRFRTTQVYSPIRKLHG